MNRTAIAPKKKRVSADPTKANGASESPQADWPVPKFQYRLGDHPLWQEFQDILDANRQADIAEANRLADLEELEARQ